MSCEPGEMMEPGRAGRKETSAMPGGHPGFQAGISIADLEMLVFIF